MFKDTVGYHLVLQAEHKETNTVRSVLNIICPAAEFMPPGERLTYFNALPLCDLRSKLNLDGSGWAPAVEESLQQRELTSKTYLKLYPGYVRRFVERCEALTSARAPVALLDEWKPVLSIMEALMPMDKDTLQNLIAMGVTSIFGYEFEGRDFRTIKKHMENMRTCMRRLASQCSERGLTPAEFGSSVLLAGNFDDIPMLKGKLIAFYHCKAVWNAVTKAEPALVLPTWPDCKKVVSLPEESYPECLLDGYEEAMFDGRKLSENTVENYQGVFKAFLGLVEAEGFSLHRLTKGLEARDALRLLTQGVAPSLVAHDPSLDTSYAIARKLVDDLVFRNEAIAFMRDLEGSYDGRESRDNPFVDIIINQRLAQGNAAAARQLIMRVSYINKHYYWIRDRHYKWIETWNGKVNDFEKNQKTNYDEKKKAAFQNPRLWEFMRNRILEVEQNLFEQAANPTKEWAIEVGDIALLHLALIYPMRREQFNMMEFGKHFDHNSWRIMFEAEDVKNGKPIDYIIPSGGRGRQCREILDLYVRVARPIKLRERYSPFVFVPDQHCASAGIHLRTAAINDILPKICDKYFADILPPALLMLNPHIIRHIVASYALVVQKSLKLAAQLLNDDPQTVLQEYSDVLASSRDELLRYYEEGD